MSRNNNKFSVVSATIALLCQYNDTVILIHCYIKGSRVLSHRLSMSMSYRLSLSMSYRLSLSLSYRPSLPLSYRLSLSLSYRLSLSLSYRLSLSLSYRRYQYGIFSTYRNTLFAFNCSSSCLMIHKCLNYAETDIKEEHL